MKILVDTNIIIDFWRKPTDELLDFFQNEDIVICGAVRSELIQGALSEKQEKIIEDRLDEYYQLSFEEEYWNVLGCMLRMIRFEGYTMPFPDVIIACIALQNDVPVLSNDKHFAVLQKIFPNLRLA